MPLVSFSPGQVISSANVDANFGLCVLTDTSRTISVTHAWTASQTFTGGWTAGAGCTMSAGSLTLGQAISKIIPGATSLSLRNNADGADNLILTDAGLATFRNTVTISAGGMVVTGTSSLAALSISGLFTTTASPTALLNFNGHNDIQIGQAGGTFAILNSTGATRLFTVFNSNGNIAIGTAASKIIPGATSLTFRNNADTQDNVAITDAGNVTVGRGDLTVSLGNFIITGIAGTVQIGGNQVIGPRLTGYTNAWTGAAANKATGYDASSITLPQLAARVRALQESLTTHGLIAA